MQFLLFKLIFYGSLKYFLIKKHGHINNFTYNNMKHLDITVEE